MAYGVFDKYDDELISGEFTNESAADDFRMLYVEDDGFESLYVDKICPKHFTAQPEGNCQCWEEMPYDDERGPLV